MTKRTFRSLGIVPFLLLLTGKLMNFYIPFELVFRLGFLIVFNWDKDFKPAIFGPIPRPHDVPAPSFKVSWKLIPEESPALP